MKKLLQTVLLLSLSAAILLSSCAVQATDTPVSPAAQDSAMVTPSVASSSATGGKITLYAPATTSSIPVILAAEKLENVDLVLYTNQSQANTIFLRGEAQFLVTGLSVGMDLYKNTAPAKLVNTYVTGLSYLVTYKKQVKHFEELKGEDIYVPFEGSPIEEASIYLAEQEGLVWGEDLTPVYSPFDASVALLKQGELSAVVLPEPTVSLVEGQPDVFVSLSYYDLWNENNPGAAGYPQVGTLVNSEWAETHDEDIRLFNQALDEAIQSVQEDPAVAIEAVKENLDFPAEILTKSLQRTYYQFAAGAEMQQGIEEYYRLIGKAVDEHYKDFYYLASN
jgi:NitT/TauT family transport system substrate-binding protein